MTTINQYGHEVIEGARLKEKREKLNRKKVPELKEILRNRSQKVSGKKEELISQLLGQEEPAKKKKIEKSSAAKILKKIIYEQDDLLEDGTRIEAEALYHIYHSEFQGYNFEKEFELSVKKCDRATTPNKNNQPLMTPM